MDGGQISFHICVLILIRKLHIHNKNRWYILYFLAKPKFSLNWFNHPCYCWESTPAYAHTERVCSSYLSVIVINLWCRIKHCFLIALQSENVCHASLLSIVYFIYIAHFGEEGMVPGSSGALTNDVNMLFFHYIFILMPHSKGNQQVKRTIFGGKNIRVYRDNSHGKYEESFGTYIFMSLYIGNIVYIYGLWNIQATNASFFHSLPKKQRRIA